MDELVADLDQFSDVWLANPAAKLTFAQLVERCVPSVAVTKTDKAVREWIAEEKRAAKAIGIK